MQKEVKSVRGIEAFYMYFNGTGIWGGETTWENVTFESVRARARAAS